MVVTIKELKDLIKKADTDVPGITYLEWLNCYNAFLSKIEEDDYRYHYQGDASDLLFVEVTGMDEETEKNYKKLIGLLRKFINAYNYAKGDYFNRYTASPKDIWNQVLQGKARVDNDPPEFRTFR